MHFSKRNNTAGREGHRKGDGCRIWGQAGDNWTTSILWLHLLRIVKLQKVREIELGAFCKCERLTDAELSEGLETVGIGAFFRCPRMRRIALPLTLKDDCLTIVTQLFLDCDDLSTVQLVGGIHKTVSLLLTESWRRSEMNEEIDLINQVLLSMYGPTRRP